MRKYRLLVLKTTCSFYDMFYKILTKDIKVIGLSRFNDIVRPTLQMQRHDKSRLSFDDKSLSSKTR